jgi:hypothetical protein
MMDYNFDIYKFQSGGVLPTQENLTFRGANIDFGDYISPDTRLIASNAAFAQKTANDRLDAIMKEREKIIDAIKLDKQYGKLTGQLTGQLNSLVEQAAQSQLSDNANFTKFNTGLISIQRDPVIQNALRSTEYAKAYADMRIKSPEIVDKPYLNGGNERDFLRFQNGETDEFILKPVYKEPKWQEEIFKFVKEMPDEEKEVFRNLGSAVYQEKTKGKTAEDIKARTSQFANYLLNSNAETASHFRRMQQFGYNPISEIQQAINAAADQYKNESITLSNMQANPNVITPYQQQSLAISRGNLDVARKNAETSRINALNRIEGGNSNVNIIYPKGRTNAQDQVDIKFGSEKYNNEYKADIAKTLMEKYGSDVSEDNIILLDADTNTGNVTYQLTTQVSEGNPKIEKRVMNLPYLRVSSAPVSPAAKSQNKTYQGLDANGKPIFK